MALDFIAGCVGGCAGVAVGHPFDTVKVRLQCQDFRNPIYRGTVHCLTRTVQQESLCGLYKGVSSPMAGVALINAISFGVYGNIIRRLPDPDSLSSHFIAGASAGGIQSIVCSPMELAKTRMQIQGQGEAGGTICHPRLHMSNQIYKGPLDCLVKIKKEEGWRGVFRGLGTTFLREAPAFGLYFVTYELLTAQEDPDIQISTAHMMFAGGMSGIVSWVTTYPVDVVKTRIQTDGIKGPRQYGGFLDCARKIFRSEGLSVFSRGIMSTVIRAFPTNAATFTVVTWMMRFMSEERDTDAYQTFSEIRSLQPNVMSRPRNFSGVYPNQMQPLLNVAALSNRNSLIHKFVPAEAPPTPALAADKWRKELWDAEVPIMLPGDWLDSWNQQHRELKLDFPLIKLKKNSNIIVMTSYCSNPTVVVDMDKFGKEEMKKSSEDHNNKKKERKVTPASASRTKHLHEQLGTWLEESKSFFYDPDHFTSQMNLF